MVGFCGFVAGVFLLIVELSLSTQWKSMFYEAVFPLSSR